MGAAVGEVGPYLPDALDMLGASYQERLTHLLQSDRGTENTYQEGQEASNCGPDRHQPNFSAWHITAALDEGKH